MRRFFLTESARRPAFWPALLVLALLLPPADAVRAAAPLKAATENAPLYAPLPDGTGDAARAKTEEPASEGDEAELALAAGDAAKAASIWRARAENGDARAMNNYGLMLDQGRGVEMDAGMAAHWFAMSARAGNAAGMANYGRMLEQGRGLPQNPREAAIWLDLAARQGQPEAQYNLGVLYEYGQGVARDEKAAAAWYSRAAAQAQPDALARLGHFYHAGKGVEKDIGRSVLLLHAAAMQGQTAAMNELEDLARENPPEAGAVLFGLSLDSAKREAMRAALARAGVRPERENGNYICDLYRAGQVVPGSKAMAACYGPRGELGFLKIDYAAPDRKRAQAVQAMVEKRFGRPSAREGEDSAIWNLGRVIVATQYAPTHQLMSLMYMVPRVYHLTRQPLK